MRVLWSGIRVDDDRKDFGDTDDKSLEGNINNDDDLGLIDVESTFIIDNVPIEQVCECIAHVLTFKYFVGSALVLVVTELIAHDLPAIVRI